MEDKYTHGHQDSVLRSHRWRTATNSAGYLLPHLHAGADLLDIGCGPGTITVDLAAIVHPGRTLGMDREPTVIEEARRTFVTDNLEFRPGDIYQLDIDDGSFDVVHAHQVLQHLTDPVRALKEMRRVLRPGGILAVRDSDYAGFVWSPLDPRLDRWLAIYHQVCTHNGADADAGRYLPAWVRSAGYRDIQPSTSTWTFADPESREWWGHLWADRMTDSSFAAQAVEYGFASAPEMRDIAQSWLEWAAHRDGLFAVLHVEVLARR